MQAGQSQLASMSSCFADSSLADQSLPVASPDTTDRSCLARTTLPTLLQLRPQHQYPIRFLV